MPNDGFVQVKSAHDPDSLRGVGLDLVVLDEAAYMSEETWIEALRPTLSDRKGRAVFLSTPNGRNYLYHLFLRGQGDDPEWKSWQLPTSANPFIDPAEIERARAELPEMIFRTEYLAEFLESGAGVFRYVREVSTAQPQSEPDPTHSYIAGVDFGRYGDFTVVSVIDAKTATQVYLDRFNEIGWEIQRARIKSVCQRWRVQNAIMEANSIGEPNIELLERDGIPIMRFQTTAASKPTLIERLVSAIERTAAGHSDGIRLLNYPVQIAELEAYQQERLELGGFRYSAPPGAHDDTVIATALAWHGVRDARVPSISFV
jgi:hypothetical protein